MLNFNSGDVQNIWTTSQTSFLVRKPQNSDCVLFDFAVEANTGVGSSGPSQPSTAGFPSCEFNPVIRMCKNMLCWLFIHAHFAFILAPEAYGIEFLVQNAFVNNDKLVTIYIYIKKVGTICMYVYIYVCIYVCM